MEFHQLTQGLIWEKFIKHHELILLILIWLFTCVFAIANVDLMRYLNLSLRPRIAASRRRRETYSPDHLELVFFRALQLVLYLLYIDPLCFIHLDWASICAGMIIAPFPGAIIPLHWYDEHDEEIWLLLSCWFLWCGRMGIHNGVKELLLVTTQPPVCEGSYEIWHGMKFNCPYWKLNMQSFKTPFNF